MKNGVEGVFWEYKQYYGCEKFVLFDLFCIKFQKNHKGS